MVEALDKSVKEESKPHPSKLNFTMALDISLQGPIARKERGKAS